MTFPNGYQGVKKIFTAEILDLIATICLIVGAIMALVLVASAGAESVSGAAVGGLGTTIFMGAAFVLIIIAYIFKMIGMKRAGRDEERFNTAFIFAIFALILTVVGSVIQSITGTTTIWDDLIKTIATLFELFVTLYIVNGIQALAQKLNHDELVAKGQTYYILFIILYILRLIASVLPVFFGVSATAVMISGIMVLVAAVLSLVVYIVYLSLLSKAKKMLKEN